MALSQFIKDLLYLNDKLIVPGFGGFVAQYSPAQINTEKHTLNPPVKYFIFDATLTQDDGVLATYLSKKKSISLSEAILTINEMVAEFKRKLEDGGTLFIEEVGYFVYDDKKQIRFKRDEEKNYNAESFGLNSVPVKTQNLHNQAPVIDEVYVPIKRKSNLVKILLIFLLINVIGALSALIYWKFSDIKSYFQNLSAKKSTISAPDTTNYKIDEDTSELSQYIDSSTNIKNALQYPEVSKTDSIATEKEVKKGTEKLYYIIAGSFQTFDKAEIHSKKLKKLGFEPEIIEFSQELFRISVGNYKTKEEAVKQLDSIKCKKETEKAWILAK